MRISGNRVLLSSVAAMVCIILYATALFIGAGRILVNTNSRGILAEKEFNDILDRASSASILGFMSKSYQDVIQDCIINSQTLLGVIITGSDGEYGFERQYGNVISWIGNSPRFKSGFGISKNPYFQSIWIEGQRNTTVQAIYSIFDYDLFIRVLRDTLGLILAVVVVAVIILLVEISHKTKAAQSYAPPVYPTSEPSMAVYDDDIPLKDPAYPKGLYSSRGLGWESYTKERLESELHRCAACEEDLVFIVMESRKSKFGEETFRKLASDAVFFTERDMIFERGEQGMALIIPALNLDQGLSKSQEFRGHVQNSMTDASGAPSDLCIGLSSRAGRLVEADRLIFEASEALLKAQKDLKSPIIAFKSDPEKYREFISRMEG